MEVCVVLAGAASPLVVTEEVLATVLGAGVGVGIVGGGGASLVRGCLTILAAGSSASSVGAVAPLGAAGLTAEPTSTPKASNAITATAVAHGAGIGTSLISSDSGESLLGPEMRI